MAGVGLWASYHLRAGRAALERYHTVEAVRHLGTARLVWPRDPEILFLSARAARRTGAFEAADHFLDLYQEVRKEDENLTLERILLRAERGEPDSVLNYCQTRIEPNDPAAPLVFEALTQGYLRNYQPQKAEKVLGKWLEQEPDNPQALFLQGQVYDLQMRHADALQSFRAALTTDPALDTARLRLCDVLMQLGLFEEAQPHVEYLRGRLPDSPKILVYLARIQDRQGHPEEVERILEEVLARWPYFAPALVDRGILAIRAGQFSEAEKYLRQAVQQDPSDFQARDRLAFCLEQNGKLAEADKEREYLKQMEKDIDEIQTIIRGQMERTPHNPDLHYRIGMISLRAGADGEALRWLYSALREDPNHQGAHKALMEYYQRKGDLSRAREHRQKLIK
jgi:tetratricopeptide (TPR) repeat protein